MKNTKTILFLLYLLFNTSVWGQQYCDEADELFKQGKYTEAKDKYELCRAHDKANETIVSLQIRKANDCIDLQKYGENYIRKEKWKSAFVYFDKIIGINPNDQKAKNRLTLCIEKGDIPNVRIETVYVTDTIIKTEKEVTFVRDTTFVIVRDTTIVQQPVDNTLNFLPFGIHQFKNKQTGKGYFFAGTQGVLLGSGIGYCLSAKSNLKKHKDPKYEDWERDGFYNKYESRKNTSKWLFIGALAMIGWNYCDNFNWFRKNNIETGFVPILDWQGRPQMAMTLKVGF